MGTTYKIDSQLYRMIERTTIENDYFVMKYLRAAGIANCVPNPGESADDYAVRLLYAVVENGMPFEFLGGLLLPEGIPDDKWSVDLANQTAAVLKKVTDPHDKKQIQSILVALISSFFVEGLRYLRPSATVSDPPTAAPPRKNGPNDEQPRLDS